MTTFTWLGSSGSWTSPANWDVDGTSNGLTPNAGDGALIVAAGPATIDMSGIVLQGLSLDKLEIASTATAIITGDAVTWAEYVQNAGTLSVQPASFAIGSGGWLNTVAGGVTTLGSTGTGPTLLENDGELGADGGTLDVLNDLTGYHGLIIVQDHGVVELGGAYAGQTVMFEGDRSGLLKFDHAQGNIGIVGFGLNTTIELVGTSATFSYSNGVLTASSGGETIASFTLGIDVPDYAMFAVTTDASGDTFISEKATSTYVWAGGSGDWSTAADWTVAGASDGNVPGVDSEIAAIAAIGGTSAETINVTAAP
jgi:hypothetical protein